MPEGIKMRETGEAKKKLLAHLFLKYLLSSVQTRNPGDKLYIRGCSCQQVHL